MVQRSYEMLRRVADKFLNEHNTERVLPVPIEMIIDNKLGINIVPIPELAEVAGLESFTWNNMDTIVVDGNIHKRYPQRLRFTLAHELGHILLHREVIKKCPRNEMDSYAHYVSNMGEKERQVFENEANNCAGLLLVPKKPLLEKYQQTLTMFPALNDRTNDETIRSYVSNWIAKDFDVTERVVEIRLCFERCWEFKKNKAP
ncbi:MAG TPA: ImmA/IrrE family metallo-endopeptidase [Elusimicrobiota bacterium]|nr:ImmA/IrrE family metallo-endopeptidase [Elusimicrobiota bacterium]